MRAQSTFFFFFFNHCCLSPAFVLVATVGAGDPPKLIQNNAAVKKNIIHTNPNFHMQIRLSQQSLSPLHHFLHSNAFSLLYKIPPLQPDAVAGLVLSELPSQFPHVFPRRRRTCMAETVFYTFYCQESVETIKNGRAGRFLFLSLCLYDESPSRSAFSRRQSVYLKALSDG